MSDTTIDEIIEQMINICKRYKISLKNIASNEIEGDKTISMPLYLIKKLFENTT
ncbi:MAG: hypothetical protein HUJ71_03740 [Pseudobutyrivibrio sp.]|nr:hypothetical protein [Pseudobutyrivibrio sp.]